MTEEFMSIESAPQECAAARGRPLTERDAVEIWIARWLRIPRKQLLGRYGCDSSRLYEIWWGERFPSSRARAAAEFVRRYPDQAGRTVFGYRRIRRSVSPEPSDQPDLFA